MTSSHGSRWLGTARALARLFPAVVLPTLVVPALALLTPRTAAAENWGESSAKELVRRGAQQEERGQFSRALRHYTDATRLSPHYAEGFLRLASVRERLGQFQDAELVYTAALSLPTGQAAALRGRSGLRFRSGHPGAALADLEAAVELDPQHRPALTELMTRYSQSRAWAAALATWRKIRALTTVTVSRSQGLALSALAAETDVVALGQDHPSWVRRSLVRLSQR